MFPILIKKIGAGLLTTLGVSIVIFIGTNLLPGDAAQIRLGQASTEDSLRALREELGLNLPLY
ncbi:MAG: ABC transporter permease, partial [Pseudomonadota bacterium]|nr:ABC transporter permease [Pseudomonadota bacterium]